MAEKMLMTLTTIWVHEFTIQAENKYCQGERQLQSPTRKYPLFTLSPDPFWSPFEGWRSPLPRYSHSSRVYISWGALRLSSHVYKVVIPRLRPVSWSSWITVILVTHLQPYGPLWAVVLQHYFIQVPVWSCGLSIHVLRHHMSGGEKGTEREKYPHQWSVV